MYPVVSILRRAAGKIVYVREEHLKVVDHNAFMPLEKASSCLNLAQGAWTKRVRSVPMYVLTASGGSPEEVAIAMTRKENELAEKAEAAEALYTLVLGEEVEDSIDGRVTRVVKMGAVRGIFRTADKELASVPAKERLVGMRRPLPEGVIVERR